MITVIYSRRDVVN